MSFRIQASSSSRTLSCQLVCFPIEIMNFRISKLAKGNEEEYLELNSKRFNFCTFVHTCSGISDSYFDLQKYVLVRHSG